MVDGRHPGGLERSGVGLAVAPQLVEPSYASGPYKLVCDDLGLANLIVRSADDLTVVGVMDLEWSYAGPAQLFGSAS